MSRFARRCAGALTLAQVFASSIVLARAPTQALATPAQVAAGPASPTQGASDSIPPRSDGRAIGACGTTDLAAMRARIEPSVVEVSGGYAASLGFAFEEPDLIVAPLEVARLGRGVEVTYAGRTLPATIVAIDPDARIALLRVPGLRVARPLTASATRPQLGTAVVGFGLDSFHPIERKLMISDGAISKLAGGRFEVATHTNAVFLAGTPLVDCSGHVLGVLTWYVDGGSPIETVQALVAKVRAGAPPYMGEWQAGPVMHLLVEVDQTREAWVGLDLGLTVVAHDQLELDLTARFLGRGDPTPANASWTRRESGVRTGADLRAGYRLMLTEGLMPFYLVPHAGVGFDYSVHWAERTRQVTSSECSSEGPCSVVTEKQDLPTETRARAFPSLGLGARVGFIDLDYAFRLDIETADRSSHQMGLGIHF
jgi:hypothetical protein